MKNTDYPVLRFVNSIEDDGKTRAQNAFADHAGLIALVEDAALSRVAPSPLPALLSLREMYYRAFSAMAAGHAPDPSVAGRVQDAIRASLSRADIALLPQGLSMRPGPDCTQVDALSLAAHDLMTSAEVIRLSECRRCTRLFIDHGRGKGRRWCDMARCGNRAKAESYRARKRATG
ncbi:CGNR zinc finger domain-containing protein [Gymnodinialimonas ulvae]|uniref:CGNR zinc finger domain-containing protein n=1 Tax=Gymnodinialimonas ulvae TaxID=3126504 RepID=UPI003095A50F